MNNPTLMSTACPSFSGETQALSTVTIWYAGKEVTVNKMIQSKLMGKRIHIAEICLNPNTHRLSLVVSLTLVMCEHICIKSRALFWFMWCGMSGMSRRIRERRGRHCLPLRSDEGASTMDATLPPSFSRPQHPNPWHLSVRGSVFPQGGGLGMGLLVKNWLGAM